MQEQPEDLQPEDLQPGDLVMYRDEVVLVLDIILDDHNPEQSIISALWPGGAVRYFFLRDAYRVSDQP